MKDPNTIVYGTFCSQIDQESARQLSLQLAKCQQGGATEIHILFQTVGGYVGDGLYLYSLFKTFPVPIYLYNSGSVQSIGAVAFLAAHHKIVSPHGLFMFHRSAIGAGSLGGEALRELAKTAEIEDERTERIIREHLALNEETWKDIDRGPTWFRADEAISSGMADTVGHFSPDPRSPFWSFNM